MKLTRFASPPPSRLFHFFPILLTAKRRIYKLVAQRWRKRSFGCQPGCKLCSFLCWLSFGLLLRAVLKMRSWAKLTRFGSLRRVFFLSFWSIVYFIWNVFSTWDCNLEACNISVSFFFFFENFQDSLFLFSGIFPFLSFFFSNIIVRRLTHDSCISFGYERSAVNCVPFFIGLDVCFDRFPKIFQIRYHTGLLFRFPSFFFNMFNLLRSAGASDGIFVPFDVNDATNCVFLLVGLEVCFDHESKSLYCESACMCFLPRDRKFSRDAGDEGHKQEGMKEITPVKFTWCFPPRHFPMRNFITYNVCKIAYAPLLQFRFA